MSLCMCVTILNTHFRVSWRLLFKECIANIGLQRQIFVFVMIFCVFHPFYVFFSQPTVDDGGVSRGGSVAVAVGINDR